MPKDSNIDLTPNEIEEIPSKTKVVIPAPIQENMGDSLGGWTAESDALSNGNIRLEATNERILIGSATNSMTGVGIFQGKDDAGTGYDWRVGDPAGDHILWDASDSTLTIVGGVDISGKLDKTGGAYASATTGARILMFPDANTGLQIIDNASNDVFKAIIGVTDVGDVIIGNYAGSQGVKYDKSAGTFDVKAILTANAGSVIGTGYLSGTIAQGNLNVADRGWTQTSVFSVTDADTIAWGIGTFTSADGTAYSISAGNTGNMSAKTYVYLDTAVSTTAYQTTTTATTAVGAGKVLIAIAQNGTTEATYQVMQGQGGQNIDAANIVAGSITANEIAASTITAGKMSVSDLSTISANVGTLTAGTIDGCDVYANNFRYKKNTIIPVFACLDGWVSSISGGCTVTPLGSNQIRMYLESASDETSFIETSAYTIIIPNNSNTSGIRWDYDPSLEFWGKVTNVGTEPTSEIRMGLTNADNVPFFGWMFQAESSGDTRIFTRYYDSSLHTGSSLAGLANQWQKYRILVTQTGTDAYTAKWYINDALVETHDIAVAMANSEEILGIKLKNNIADVSKNTEVIITQAIFQQSYS
jgi:hypothetical protein